MKLLSIEARRALQNAETPLTDRSLSGLSELRYKTRQEIAPSVESIFKQKNFETEIKEIRGIPCLYVYPLQLKVNWQILYGYGGGFVSGSPFEDLTIAAPISVATGAVLIIPDYRLAPENPWPAALDDSFSVYQALSDKPFGLVGESAGGNLGLALIHLARQASLRLPDAAAFISPWCDLTNSGDSIDFNDGRDPSLTKQHLKFAAEHYAGENDRSDPKISPINGAFDRTFPPCYISTGTRDLLMSQSVSLADKLCRQGGTVNLRVWQDLWHVFEWDNNLPEAKTSIREISNFLTDHMTRPSCS
jgi:monoterpene epsilon-lactone hydrolase